MITMQTGQGSKLPVKSYGTWVSYVYKLQYRKESYLNVYGITNLISISETPWSH